MAADFKTHTFFFGLQATATGRAFGCLGLFFTLEETKEHQSYNHTLTLTLVQQAGHSLVLLWLLGDGRSTKAGRESPFFFSLLSSFFSSFLFCPAFKAATPFFLPIV